MDEEEKNKEDVEAYKKNEEEWLLQTPLDDELGEYFFISLTWRSWMRDCFKRGTSLLNWKK